MWRDIWRRKMLIEKKQSSILSVTGSITARDFDRILGYCEAITDAPGALLWAELMDAYSDANLVIAPHIA